MSVIGFSRGFWVLLWIRESWILLQHHQLTKRKEVMVTWEALGLMRKTDQRQSEDEPKRSVLELTGWNELSVYWCCLRAPWLLLDSIKGHRLSGTARDSAGTACCQLKTHQLPATIIRQTACACGTGRRAEWRWPAEIRLPSGASPAVSLCFKAPGWINELNHHFSYTFKLTYTTSNKPPAHTG